MSIRFFKLISGLVLFNVLIFTALRLAFLYQFHTPADPLSSDLMMKSLYIGLKFDVRLVLLINLPVFLSKFHELIIKLAIIEK